jgi:hypothetical protein
VRRNDLLALSDDGLAQLANVGLVKRGRRDLAEGKAPAVSVSDDGTVQADFADGTVTRLAPGRSIVDATCSCPASGVCRHRVVLVLTYQAERGGGGDVADTPGAVATSESLDDLARNTDAGAGADAAKGRATSATTIPPHATAWDPADFDVDAFVASLSASLRTELARLRAARLDVRLEHGAVPAAHLPMATVRFLVPQVLAYSRCDCVAGGNCVHVALAIQAFRQARGATETRLEPASGVTDARYGSRLDALRIAGDALLARLLDVGLNNGMDAFVQPLADARAAADALGAVQYLLALDGLAQQIDAYAARSARHSERLALQLATELYARSRTTDPRVALGIGETLDTAMGRTRLVSLGARLRGDAGQADASVLLADLDTGAVMLLERRVTHARDTGVPAVAVLAQRPIAAGVTLAAAAQGQILTSSGRRRVDGRLVLGTQRGGKTQAMPYDGNAPLRAPLLVSQADVLVDTLSTRPPAFVRRHDATGDVRVFEVDAVLGQSLTEGGQRWQGAVALAGDGGTLRLQREYDAVAPAALEVLAQALAGGYGRLRRIAGPVTLENGVLVCEPWSLLADRFVVPDLEPASDTTPSPPLPHHGDMAATQLELGLQLLAGAVHAGRRAGPADATVRRNARAVAEQLKETGYLQAAGYVAAWCSRPDETGADTDGLVRFGDAACFLQALG